MMVGFEVEEILLWCCHVEGECACGSEFFSSLYLLMISHALLIVGDAFKDFWLFE